MTPGPKDRQKRRKNTLLGAVSGALITLFPKKSPRTTREDLEKHDFSTSTQRFGGRFSEQIRAKFRHRWLKKH
jgi:hypothetical protein